MIRNGTMQDYEQVNLLRKEVNDLHVQGQPDIFKPGFCKEMQEYLKEFIDSQDKQLIVCEKDGQICGYAMLEFICKPETAYRYALEYIEVGELGVSKNYQKQGIGKQLMQEVKNIAQQRKIKKIELNMWSFNDNALNFYEKLGFNTYRRHMNIKL